LNTSQIDGGQPPFLHAIRPPLTLAISSICVALAGSHSNRIQDEICSRNWPISQVDSEICAMLLNGISRPG
jgi:hypothetical protein